MSGRLLFDVAINALLAFGVSALLVLLVRFCTRRLRGNWATLLLALPFIKGVVELVRVAPAHSFYWAFQQGARQDLGGFQLGFGMGLGRLNVVAGLSALSRGTVYPTSAGELLSRGLVLNGYGRLIDASGWLIVCVAALLMCRRVLAGVHFERKRRRDAACAEQWGWVRVGRRQVMIYLSPGLAEQAPFAGGVLRPYVCFSRHAWNALNEHEREAVLAHELAHIRGFDVVWLSMVGLMADALWFCPGVGALRRAFSAALETAADASAVAHGVNPLRLASAIVRLQRARPSLAAITSFSPAAGLRRRLAILLDPSAAKPSLKIGPWGWLLRLAILIATGNSLLWAVFLGHHG